MPQPEKVMKKSNAGPMGRASFDFPRRGMVLGLLIGLFFCLAACVEKPQESAPGESCTAQCPIPPPCTPVQEEFIVHSCVPCPPCPPGSPAPREKTTSKPSHIARLALEDYPQFEDDLGFEGLKEVLLQSIAFYDRVSSTRPVRFGNDVYTAGHMKASCNALMKLIQTKPDTKTLNRTVREHFLVYKAGGTPAPGSELRPRDKVLFTGYYEPVLGGSRTKNEKYSVPLHAPPSDLAIVDLSPFGKEFAGKKIHGRWTGTTFAPYHDWEAISYTGVLDGKAPAVAYIGDEVDKFFLQVQGSGIVDLEEGGLLRVHYKIQNGRPYHSIGAFLVQAGKIPRKEISMQKIREYLKAHPEEQRKILSMNPSYVFFEVVEEGPLGALSVPLTPGRSIAVDRRLFPDAAPAFIKTEKPVLDTKGEILSWTPFSRFMAAQDTGGAIKGAGRADIFWGNGEYAEIAAGHLQHPGDMYFLVLKPKK